jgi:hypothetical protein
MTRCERPILPPSETWDRRFVAAMRALGRSEARLEYYRVIPEWITGMGIVTAESERG